MKNSFYSKYGKRLLDLVAAAIGGILLLPIIFTVAVLVKLKLGSPIIFSQIRPGRNETLFKMYKFRTMTDETDIDGNLLPDDQRLTKFGKILRSTSLDELPELWNILKGDMSFVGPRPLLVQYLSIYSDVQKRRHEVRPGLTGLAQINGRNAISWEEKFDYDLKYVDNYSLFIDLSILFLTIKKVFQKEGIHSRTSETMEFFQGSKGER